MKLFGSSSKSKTTYTDQDILHQLREGGQNMETALFWLYDRYFHKVRVALAKHKLLEDDLLEVYSEALMALRDQVRAGKFEQRSSLETFFARIFEFKCIDKIRRNATKDKATLKYQNDPSNDVWQDSPEAALIHTEEDAESLRHDALRKFCLDLAMQAFQPRDQDILIDYFINKLRPAAVAEKYQFKTDRVAATTASKLKKDLQDAIRTLCEKDMRCRILCP